MHRPATASVMPRKIKGVEYYSTAEVCEAADVSRQTLWRWRQEGHAPPGHRFRNGQVLFTSTELRAVLAHALKVEPTDLDSDPAQLAFRLEHGR